MFYNLKPDDNSDLITAAHMVLLICESCSPQLQVIEVQQSRLLSVQLDRDELFVFFGNIWPQMEEMDELPEQ